MSSGRHDGRGSQKHEREAVRMVERMHPGLSARVEARGPKHKRLVASMGEDQVSLVLSCSPSDETQMLQHLRQQCRQAFRAKGIEL